MILCCFLFAICSDKMFGYLCEQWMLQDHKHRTRKAKCRPKIECNRESIRKERI